jgi:hypothetical protein
VIVGISKSLGEAEDDGRLEADNRRGAVSAGLTGDL